MLFPKFPCQLEPQVLFDSFAPILISVHGFIRRSIQLPIPNDNSLSNILAFVVISHSVDLRIHLRIKFQPQFVILAFHIPRTQTLKSENERRKPKF